MASLCVVFDLVVCAKANPVRNRSVLAHLLRKFALDGRSFGSRHGSIEEPSVRNDFARRQTETSLMRRLQIVQSASSIEMQREGAFLM